MLDDEATALVFQRQLPESVRFVIDDRAAATVLRRCGNHPFLLQLVCTQLLELGDADVAVNRTVADRAAAFFFAVDFDLLSNLERRILSTLCHSEGLQQETLITACSAEAQAVARGLNRLENLGFVDCEGQQVTLVNDLFRHWLKSQAITV